MGNNTTHHEYNTRQHGTAQDNTRRHGYNTSTTRHNTKQHEYNTANTSKTRPSRSTKEALAANIGLHFAFFVTELYIFLISFRNS